ncbi:MAG: hypothetical protein KGK07_16280 [Chloroflexota bacterium]|nr:hypothetical protein [Chloroflexota bacterium]
MIDLDIDPVSGCPNRYDEEDGYPRAYVLMPPSPHLHDYQMPYSAPPDGDAARWWQCWAASPDGRARRPGEARCDAPWLLREGA